jgi:hypothetical protein
MARDKAMVVDMANNEAKVKAMDRAAAAADRLSLVGESTIKARRASWSGALLPFIMADNT